MLCSWLVAEIPVRREMNLIAMYEFKSTVERGTAFFQGAISLSDYTSTVNDAYICFSFIIIV